MTDSPYGNGHAKAYRKWFAEFETRRKAARLSPGRRPKGMPAPPTDPETLQRWAHDGIEVVGEARVLSLLRIHRTTLYRWLNGDSQMPESAALVLRLLGDGLHPAASDEWAGFRFDGDRLILPDGSSYTAREVQGWHWQATVLRLAEARIERLEAALVKAVKQVEWGTANDAYAHAQDPRSRAFGSGV